MSSSEKIDFLSDAITKGTEDDCWMATKEIRKSYFDIGPNISKITPTLLNAKNRYSKTNPKLSGDISDTLTVLESAGIIISKQYIISEDMTPDEPIESPTSISQPPANPSNQIAIAILDFKPGGGLSASDATVAADWLRNTLVNSHRFRVIERQNMDKILAEQAFQQTGCTDQGCAVKLGKMLNSSLIVTGNFSKFMSIFVIGIHVVNVETGEIVHADEAKGKNEDELISAIRIMGSKLTDSFPTKP